MSVQVVRIICRRLDVHVFSGWRAVRARSCAAGLEFQVPTTRPADPYARATRPLDASSYFAGDKANVVPRSFAPVPYLLPTSATLPGRRLRITASRRSRGIAARTTGSSLAQIRALFANASPPTAWVRGGPKLRAASEERPCCQSREAGGNLQKRQLQEVQKSTIGQSLAKPCPEART